MRIHVIQTGTVAIKQRQVHGIGHGFQRRLNTLLDSRWTEPLPIYVWVIDHPEGVIVVDTGETSRVAEPGYFPWWHPYFRFGVREWVRPEEEVGPQLRALGIEPSDVRWLVMTHLHTDHAGGLHHFPKTEILLSRAEFDVAAGWRGRLEGYLLPAFGPFPVSHVLTQAADVLLVPTPGHTAGHLSVIVLEDDHAVMLAGDTSYTQQLMRDKVVDGVAPNDQVYQQTSHCIHTYTQQMPTVYLPTHDPDSAQRLAARTTVAFPNTTTPG